MGSKFPFPSPIPLFYSAFENALYLNEKFTKKYSYMFFVSGNLDLFKLFVDEYFFIGVFLFPVWLYIGLFCIVINLSRILDTETDKLGHILVAFAIATVFAPTIWCLSMPTYQQYRANRVYSALDTFITKAAETNQIPEGFHIQSRSDNILNDVSQEYEIVSADEFYGEHEITIRFANGTKYYLAINEAHQGWRIFINSRDNR